MIVRLGDGRYMMMMERYGRSKMWGHASPNQENQEFFIHHSTNYVKHLRYLKYFVDTNGIFVTIAARSFPRT